MGDIARVYSGSAWAGSPGSSRLNNPTHLRQATLFTVHFWEKKITHSYALFML